MGRHHTARVIYGFHLPVVVKPRPFGSKDCAERPWRELASADLLGQGDNDARGAAEIAEQVAVLVLRYHAEELGIWNPEALTGLRR